MRSLRVFLFTSLSCAQVYAATYNVTSNADTITFGTLRFGILNANPGDVIELSGIEGETIDLTAANLALPITIDLTIQNSGGNDVFIDGQNAIPIFYVSGTGSLTLQNNITLENGEALGGAGGTGSDPLGIPVGSSGGGGGGFGGALYIDSGGSASLSNVTFSSNSAIGGAGGTEFIHTLAIGGDGGAGGANGSGATAGPMSGGGGGGGAGWGLGNGGGAGGSDTSAAIGGAGESGNGGNSGFTGTPPTAPTGGGGGGGGFSTTGGTGGFGGGAGGSFQTNNGGAGGFGGGGGGQIAATAGSGGFAGGAGGSIFGGGGAALGGAIFVVEGGSLSIGDSVAFSGNTVTGGGVGSGRGAVAGSAFGPDLFLNSGSTLTFDPSESITFSSIIAGDPLNPGGGLVLNASSPSISVTLTAVNTYSGTTTLNQGILAVDGSIATATTVNSGGTLGGTGTVTGTVTVNSGGTISPGSASSILNLVGPLILNAGSITGSTVNPTGSSSLISVTGTASLNGTLAVTAATGNYGSVTYTVLSATGGFGGTTYSSLSIPPGFYASGIAYVGNNVQIVGFSSINLNPNSTFTGNTGAIGNYLNSVITAPSLQSVLTTLFLLNPSQLKAALNSISPSRNSFSTYAAGNTSFAIMNTFSNRLANQRQLVQMRKRNPELAARLMEEWDGAKLLAQAENEALPSNNSDTGQEGETPEKEQLPHGSAVTLANEQNNYAFWVEGIGEFAHQDAANANPAFHFTTGGGLLGFDYFGDAGEVGAAAGFAFSGIMDDGDAGSATVNFAAAAVYGTAYYDNWYFELGLLGAYNHYTNKRHVFFPGFDAVARSSHDGGQIVPHLEAGYDFPFSWGAIEPFARLDCAILIQEGFSEHGAGVLDMTQNSLTSEFLRGEIGLNFYETWQGDWGLCVLREKLSYINKKGFDLGKISGASLVGTPLGVTFTVNSFTADQSLISPSLELLYRWRKAFFFTLEYEGEFGNGYSSNEIAGKIGAYF